MSWGSIAKVDVITWCEWAAPSMLVVVHVSFLPLSWLNPPPYKHFSSRDSWFSLWYDLTDCVLWSWWSSNNTNFATHWHFGCDCYLYSLLKSRFNSIRSLRCIQLSRTPHMNLSWIISSVPSKLHPLAIECSSETKVVMFSPGLCLSVELVSLHYLCWCRIVVLVIHQLFDQFSPSPQYHGHCGSRS